MDRVPLVQVAELLLYQGSVSGSGGCSLYMCSGVRARLCLPRPPTASPVPVLDPPLLCVCVRAPTLPLAQGDLAKELRDWVPPKLPVDGRTLRAAGVQPGPPMGEILKGMMEQWKASRFTLTKDELLATLPSQEGQ